MQAHATDAGSVCLGARGDDAPGCPHQVSIPLPGVEIALPHGLPLSGAATGQLKAIDQRFSENRITVTFEAPGGTAYELKVRINRSGVCVSGGELSAGVLHVQFPPGEGFQ